MNTMRLALLALIFGNLLASLSDVAVKLLDNESSVYQYVFLRQLIATLVAAPFYFRGRKQNDLAVNWKITAIRSHLIIVGAGCMVVAITHLPLATANAVFYAGPLLMLPLSIWLLKETLKIEKVIASIIGFTGVLIVLRPSQFHWAAIFALGTAMSLALFHVLVRKLPSEHSVIHTLFWTSVVSLPISGLLALFDWQPLELTQYFWILASSLCVLAYNALAVFAYKKAQADEIALAEYSGLIFVTLFGVWWFNEIPDLLTLIGIILIVMPLIPYRALNRAYRNKRPQ
ncbi:DMT family transporter [Vibrio sp. DW001]|uniref:DMT family transporter n=1 Tax=Vibrio sp. DW001 TaxID=2912315 RepID=UPI0023B0E6D6|nr:DMT family transporter [Vibrio sp. DW001]WED28304.1 DMT family transporter [Vibrio sp. DW001]